MRRFIVVVSALAAGGACVPLDKPAPVAECATQPGGCVNGNPDSGPGRTDSHGPSVPEPDGASLTEDGAATARNDGSVRTDADGGGRPADASPSVGIDGSQADVPIAGGDGPQASWDVAAPDALPGACSTNGVAKPAGTVCRAAAGPCDVDEVCDGVSLECPTDKLAAAATPCRRAAGDCDIAETCDGTTPACPPDGFKAAGTVCRPAGGVCDVAESCDGATPACPVDSVAPATTVCRVSADNRQCDPSENCDGTGATCPADVQYTRPAAPTQVTATAGNLQAALSWTASAGATGYNVKQSTTSGTGYTTLVGSPTATASPYTAKGLAGGATYYYVISAINTIATCESANSAEVSATATGSCTPPDAPLITATVGDGSVTVSWAAVPGAVSYSVARSQTDGTGYATIGTVTTGTAFTDGTVASGVTYYYVVTASNGNCRSSNSNQAASSPNCTPPAAPKNLTATPADGSVTLTWTASLGAVHYSIYRNNTGVEPFAFVNSTAQLTFTDSGLTNNIGYYYVVRASNGSCASESSAVVAVTPACVPPSAPTGVVVTPGNEQLALSWVAPAGATQYLVARNTTGFDPFIQVGTPTTTNYTDQALSNGTTYYYIVAASNGSCWSTFSEVASGTPLCTPPPVPGTLVATPGDGQVSLSWGASQGATVYTIWRKAGAAGAYAKLGTSTSTTYTDKPLSNGTTYYYQITAGNGSCDSDYCPEQGATPVAACSQSPPGNVKATPSGSVQITLTWTASSPVPATYTIARSTTSGTGYVSKDSVAGNVLTYTDTDTALVKNKTYYYQITANGSCVATSAEVYATTACANPSAPGPLGVVSNTSGSDAGSITVSWPAVTGATAYTVYRDTSATGSFTDAVSADQTAATFTDPSRELVNGDTYFYEVSASNAGGQCVSGKSSPGSAMSCAPPAIPGGLNASVGTSGQVKLSWTASTGATQYTILRSNTSSAETPVHTVTPPPSPPPTTYTDTGLTDWATYFYKVSAQNGHNNACSSAASAETKATPNGCPVLPAGTANYQPPNTLGAYCVVTCYDIAGLGVSNFNGRSLTVNGTAINCPQGGGNCTMPASLPKDFGTYATSGAYTFRVTAGSVEYSSVYWWAGTSMNCQ
jgi:fibronectin type 3 domain-containing protein